VSRSISTVAARLACLYYADYYTRRAGPRARGPGSFAVKPTAPRWQGQPPHSPACPYARPRRPAAAGPSTTKRAAVPRSATRSHFRSHSMSINTAQLHLPCPAPGAARLGLPHDGHRAPYPATTQGEHSAGALSTRRAPPDSVCLSMPGPVRHIMRRSASSVRLSLCRLSSSGPGPGKQVRTVGQAGCRTVHRATRRASRKPIRHRDALSVKQIRMSRLTRIAPRMCRQATV
jgi:hypothetical protein